MLWWAYAGMSGSIAACFASAVFLLGMKPESIARLTAETLIAFLLAGLLVQALAHLVTKPAKSSKSGNTRLALLTSEALFQRTTNHAPAKPTEPPPPPAKRPRPVAGLRATPENT